MTIRLFALLAFLFCCSISYAEEAVEIPLSEVWALNMPGTQNVRELEPQKNNYDKMTVSKIARALILRSSELAKAGPCFLVTGEGKEALLNAAKVIVDGESPAKSLPTDEKLSLVFYSYSAPGYVHLQSVHRSHSHIVLKYQVVTHRTANSTVHFALIPLGKLTASRVILETFEVPSDTPYPKHSITHRATCESCTFVIQDEGKQP